MLAILLSVVVSASPAPAKPTQIILDVKPATTQVFVDGKKLGKATKVFTLNVKPGTHKIKLVAKISTQEEVVSAKAGEKTKLTYDLRDSGDAANREPSVPSGGESSNQDPALPSDSP
jgi:hypothetical protein